MIRRPPISTRTDTLFPYTTLFRSEVLQGRRAAEMLVQTIDDNRDITGPIRWRVRYCATGQHVSGLWCARRRLVRHRPRWSPACTGDAQHLRWCRQSQNDRPDPSADPWSRPFSSEELRVGKEWVRTDRSRGSPLL